MTEKFKLTSKDYKAFLITPSTKQYLAIEADKIVLREKGVEILSLPLEEFASQYDKIIFRGKNGKQTTFVKLRSDIHPLMQTSGDQVEVSE